MEPPTLERTASTASKDNKADEDSIHVPELHSSPLRPLSAATTTTSNTITPKQRAPSRIPIATVAEEAPAKQPKKHLFGIPLPSPLKSSFGGSSRCNTPSDAASSRSVVSDTKKSKPKPAIGQGAPSSNLSKFFVPGTGMRVSSAPEAQRKPSPSKIPMPKQTNSPISPKPSPRTSVVPKATTATAAKAKGPHVSAATVILEPGSTQSTPTRRYMSEVGNTTRVHDPPTPTSTPRASVNVVGTGTRVRTNTMGSLVQTRTGISTPRASLRTSVASAVPPSPVARVRSLSTGAGGSAVGVATRSSATTLSTVSSHSLSMRERRTSSESHVPRVYGRATTRLDGIAEQKDVVVVATQAATGNSAKVINNPSTTHVPASMPTATTTKSSGTPTVVGSVASRKHGSFDFERPGLVGRSAATTLGIGPRARRDAPRVDESGRLRTTNAGMAGVGAARFYASTSAATGNRNVRVVPPPTPPELEPSHTGNSASTSASRSNVGASSWSRATGKRLSAGFSKLTSGLGLGGGEKSVVSKTSTVHAGKDRQHGKFPFEPPVSSPKMARRELSLDSQPEQLERVSRPLSPGKGHNPSHSTGSTTSSNHTGVSAGYRSGKKGRSLDLGLGLSWAPTKVREDAVMPESSFGRSLSASRREKRGKELAEEFRHALDEDGFRAFKKYVHRFDTHEIPFDGPTGIVTRVERLLRKAHHLDEDERTRLLDNFIKLTLSAA